MEKKIFNSSLIALTALFILTSGAYGQSYAKSGTAVPLEKQILVQDSLFWIAYNNCDVEKMTSFFTDDMEFYHDKGGLTSTLPTFRDAIAKGLCSNSNNRLRREAIPGTYKVYPLNNYGAILSGEHVFYIIDKKGKETLDGQARFTHVWRYKDNQWKMHRVLSYDHGPATYRPIKK